MATGLFEVRHYLIKNNKYKDTPHQTRQLQTPRLVGFALNTVYYACTTAVK